jgi:hypothetical protein
MTAHRKDHGLTSSADHNPGTNNTVPATIGGVVAEQAFSATATAGTIALRDGAGQVVVPTTPTAANQATSKSYVDSAIVSGTTWKELLLASQQLLNGGAILQGILATIVNELTVGDTFVITDGSTTETFTIVAAAPVAFQFLLGGSPTNTITNLVASINADSTLWSAVKTFGLDDYFTGNQDPQFVVYRTAYSAAADRVYGTLNTQTDIQIVEFATGAQDYQEASGTQSALPGSDPAAKRFGFGRASASLQTGNTHVIATDNTNYTWDGDNDVWQQTGTGFSTTAGDGIDVTGGRVSTDVATATAQQKYGALTNRALSDGSALGAAVDTGFNAVQTNNTDLNVSATNELQIKPASRLDRLRALGSWTSGSAPDKEPILAELQAALGTGAGDIGNWTFMVEDGTAVGSNSTFLAFKKANAGVLADYHLVELSA